MSESAKSIVMKLFDVIIGVTSAGLIAGVVKLSGTISDLTIEQAVLKSQLKSIEVSYGSDSAVRQIDHDRVVQFDTAIGSLTIAISKLEVHIEKLEETIVGMRISR